MLNRGTTCLYGDPMPEINEFALNLPMTGVTAVAPTMNATPDPTMDIGYDITADICTPPDVSPEYKHITVSVDSATITNYDNNMPMVNIDLVLNVNISMAACAGAPVSAVSSYKIVKRLGLDRIKLALQAEGMSPYQVVEDQEDPAEVAKMMGEFYAARRARELVGLAEATGDKSFNVLFRFQDPANGENWIGESVKIDAVKDAAHARHVFATHHAPKYKGVKITHATEIK